MFSKLFQLFLIKIKEIAVFSQLFQLFQWFSIYGQCWGARLPIDWKSFKKLEKLWKHSYFFDFHKKKLEKLGKLSYFKLFCRKKLEKLWKTMVLALLCQNSCVLPAFGDIDETWLVCSSAFVEFDALSVVQDQSSSSFLITHQAAIRHN